MLEDIIEECCGTNTRFRVSCINDINGFSNYDFKEEKEELK